MTQILSTLAILIIAFNTLSFEQIKYLSKEYWLNSAKLGAFTEITSSNQLSAFPTTYNANLAKTIETGTTTISFIHTLPDLATTTKLSSIGTINTGVWNGTEIGAAYGGRGTVTQSQYRVVLGGGSNGLSIATSTGSAGYVFMSSGEGKNPSWQALPPTNQSDNYVWTGLHRFDSPLNASSTLLVNSRLSVATSSPSTTVNLVVNGGALISGTTTVSNLVVASTTPFRASSTIITATSTWTVPAKVSRVKVRLVGGGGSSGTCNGSCSAGDGSKTGGGGGGAYAEAWVSVSGLTSVTVNIGIGGVANPNTSPFTGNNGGNTSFAGNTTITAGGGVASIGNNSAGYTAGGAGGTCTNADFCVTGKAGRKGSTSLLPDGGDSFMGFGGMGADADVGSAENGTAYGGGGGGTAGTNTLGANGANGVAILEWIEGD